MKPYWVSLFPESNLIYKEIFTVALSEGQDPMHRTDYLVIHVLILWSAASQEHLSTWSTSVLHSPVLLPLEPQLAIWGLAVWDMSTQRVP